ncbi:MAG: hypothetical protein WC102_00605 [Saccharofermentanales bacterium]
MKKALTSYNIISGQPQITWQYKIGENYVSINQHDQYVSEWRKGDLIFLRTVVYLLNLGNGYDEMVQSHEVDLKLVFSWHSSYTQGGSSIRGFIDSCPVDLEKKGDFTLSGQVDGNLVGKQITLILKIVVASDFLDKGLPQGTVLWKSEQTLILSGDKSQFPMQIVSFSKLTNANRNAFFRLKKIDSDLDEAFVNGYLLQINQDNKLTKIINVAQFSTEEQLGIVQFLSFELYKSLLLDAARVSDSLVQYYTSKTPFPGSVAEAYLGIIQLVFPNSAGMPTKVKQSLAQLLSNPNQFDEKIQSLVFD